jgi:hypothetical protein
MADIAPRYRSTPLVMISRPTGGPATAHLAGPATGTLCGLPSSATNAAFTQADLLLLELMLAGVTPCPVCAEVVLAQTVEDLPPVNPGAA